MVKECDSVAAMKSMAVEDDKEVIFRKRRRFFSDLEFENNEHDELVENLASPAVSRTSGEDESKDVVEESSRAGDLENLELKLDGFESEISTSMASGYSREATPTSELRGDSEEMSTKKPAAARRRKFPTISLAEKMPSTAELEEFFTTAEKYEQKRFAEKYNYDIVKDVPLEGKYQWVRLKP